MLKNGNITEIRMAEFYGQMYSQLGEDSSQFFMNFSFNREKCWGTTRKPTPKGPTFSCHPDSRQ